MHRDWIDTRAGMSTKGQNNTQMTYFEAEWEHDGPMATLLCGWPDVSCAYKRGAGQLIKPEVIPGPEQPLFKAYCGQLMTSAIMVDKDIVELLVIVLINWYPEVKRCFPGSPLEVRFCIDIV